MSTPRTKRQFAGASRDPAQRHITSFFTTGDSTASSSISQKPSELSPSLPATVQSNLLSVGMRVRKSVPEGYKTGSYSAFSLWDERSDSTTAASYTNTAPLQRELTPFCGIHKVGGLDTQPEHLQYACQPLLSINDAPLDDDLNDIPGLTSSQDSVDSMGSNPPAFGYAPTKTRKRIFVEDEEDNTSPETLSRHLNVNTANQDAAWRGADFDGEISPRSLAPVGWGNKARVMAVPRKGRLRGKLAGLGTTSPSEGQENVMVVDSSGDFEEAEFLTDRGMWEVDMSDI